jgi:localization factor PodJL
MRHVPWHVRGVGPEAREVARDAARRSGLSVGEWLHSLIIDAAADDGSTAGDYLDPAPPRPAAHLQPHRNDDLRFGAIRRDIDELKWQIDRLSQGHGARPATGFDEGRDGSSGAKLAESIARIERRLEGLNRNGKHRADDPASYPAGGSEKHLGVDDAFAEIAARQQLLDAESPETQPFGAQAFAHEMPRPQTQMDPSPIEHQLRDIATRIKALQGASQSGGLATEIAHTVEHAAPKRAIEAVEEQLRRLTTQLESMRPSVPMDQSLESLRRDVADIGRRIGDAMPQRAVTAIEEQIRALSSEVAKLQRPPRAEDIADILRKDFAGFRATLENASRVPHMASIEEQVRALTGDVAKLQRPPRAEDIADILRKDFAGFRATLENVSTPPQMASIEEQVRALTGEVAKLHPPLRIEDVAAVLRSDLDEVGAVLANTIPQRTVASIEEQVQALNAQIAKLHAPPPMDEIAQVLRQDLVEIGAVLHDALPTSAIAALEQEVRSLGERLEVNRGSVLESPATAEFEPALAEIRDRLRALTPAEDLSELSHAVQSLSRKADALASDSAAPEMLHHLEQAIGALHDLASQVASQDAVAGLSRDIHSLGDKIDRSSRQADPDIMATLERRLAEMAEAVGGSRPAEGPAIPVDFDAVIKTLADRLEATQIPAVDQGALRSLEQRIVKLVDKLEESEARIGRHDGAERGMDELLAQLKELRVQNEHKLQAIQQQLVASTAEAISAPAEAIRRDVATLKEIQASADRRTQDTFEAVYGTIEQVVDRLATIEEGLRGGLPAGHAAAPAAASLTAVREPVAESPAASAVPTTTAASDTHVVAVPGAQIIEPQIRPESSGKLPAASGSSPARPDAASAQARRPIISDLPPDAPLEPGSGARRVRVVANAIDRIAASEAVAGPAKPAEAAPPTRANFVAAARRAAQAVASEQGEPPAAGAEKAVQEPKEKAPPGKLMQRLGSRIKSVVLGISVILLVLGALRLALDLFNADSSTSPVTRMEDAEQPEAAAPAPQPPPDPPRTGKGAGLEVPPLAGSRANLLSAETTLGQMPTSGVLPDPAVPAPLFRPVVVPASMPAAADTTGSLPIRNPLLQGPAGATAVLPPAPAVPQAAPAHDLVRGSLPATIGGKALIAAAVAGEPGASYEVAIRFAEGRNVSQDLAQAAAWFDHAARSGLAPAQFRLGTMYEKGLGIKKDLQEARRLYLAAADKGNAKAMHNLAVLYAEGLEGKPDYAVASQWFRKAAAFGIVDSQYNLAILFARGVGVERSMAESYKWLALAAKGGDKDAVKKRDEIAGRLDPTQLESAKQAIEAFVPEQQPDEATSAKAPPGGWDQVVTAAPTKGRAR